jgi:hypothetical protein
VFVENEQQSHIDGLGSFGVSQKCPHASEAERSHIRKNFEKMVREFNKWEALHSVKKETTPHLKTFAAFLEKTGRGKICYHYFDFQGKQAGQFFAQPNINIYD